MSWLSDIFSGSAKGLIDGIGQTLDRFIQTGDEKAQLKLELEKIITERLQADAAQALKEMDSQQKVLVAEIQAESWLQRNWRPLLMLSFTAIVVNNYIVVPIFRTQPMDVPPQMWELLKIGVGGYILGRTAEKGLKTWKGQ